jgi:hypothetical protein
MVFKTIKSLMRPRRSAWTGLKRWRLVIEPALLLAIILGLERAGAYCTSDYHDMAVLVIMIPLVIAAFLYHHKRESLLLAALGDLLEKAWKGLRKRFYIEVGANFRKGRESEVQEGNPYRDLRFYLLGALLFSAILLPFHASFPAALKGIHEYVLYTPYLLAVALLWTLLGGTILLDLLIVVVLFYHYVLRSPYYNPRSHRKGRPWLEKVHLKRFAIFSAMLLALAGLETVAGRTGWFWLMVSSALFTAGLAFLPRSNETVNLLIKNPRLERIQSISISEWNFSFYSIIQTVGIGLFVIATGAFFMPAGDGGASTSMPLTYMLGRIFGIATSMATLFYLFATLDFLDVKRLRIDPALPRMKKLLFRAGTLPGGLEVPGWMLKATNRPPRRDEADLYFDTYPAGIRASGAPPLKKDLRMIQPKDRRFYLDHADYIAKRRIFYRGLKRLMKICHASEFRDGAGFIMIPHCYFIEGLHRDDRNEDLEENRVIGPLFQDLWGVRVRHFLHVVLEAMDIDIIYFEDGVRFPALKSVLEVLFELYHTRGPNFRIEEYHFAGLTQVKVLLEMIQPDKPRQEKGEYPETHFTNLSQARVLIIFKDSGGGKDLHPDFMPGVDIDIPALF